VSYLYVDDVLLTLAPPSTPPTKPAAKPTTGRCLRPKGRKGSAYRCAMMMAMMKKPKAA
jgi:hypothetical protein